jgi:hypothetical protein
MGSESGYYQANQWGQVLQGQYSELGDSSMKNYEALMGGAVHNSGYLYDWIQTDVTLLFTPTSYAPNTFYDSEIEGNVSVSFWSGNGGSVTVPISSGYFSGYAVPEPSSLGILGIGVIGMLVTWRRARR